MTTHRYSKIYSCTLFGISGIKVEIEVSIQPGLSVFEIVGLADSAVRESRDRVHAALRNSGFEFPAGRITVGMAPAFIRKTGSAYDLPVALAVLAASRQIDKIPDNVCIAGEISLDGSVKKIPGVINRVITAAGEGFARIIVPLGNLAEGYGIEGIDSYGVTSINDCINLLKTKGEWKKSCPDSFDMPYVESYRDISTIVGQPMAIRALQIAAAGRHNMMMVGSPGCGKSSIAAVLPGILPDLLPKEGIDVVRIYSSCSLLKHGQSVIRTRPFRSPHHSISSSALAGGGSYPIPGEMTLAHTGVLFLDEINEFKPEVLDMLRQPMEEHIVRICRNKYSIEYPADFILIAAANPCKCGNYLERGKGKTCKCSEYSIERHMAAISGPLLDRIDIYTELFGVGSKDLGLSIQLNEDKQSVAIKERVAQAWEVQFERCRRNDIAPIHNSRMQSDFISHVFEIDSKFELMAREAAARMHISIRGYHKILRVARTIADYDGYRQVTSAHFAQALQMRKK